MCCVGKVIMYHLYNLHFCVYTLHIYIYICTTFYPIESYIYIEYINISYHIYIYISYFESYRIIYIMGDDLIGWFHLRCSPPLQGGRGSQGARRLPSRPDGAQRPGGAHGDRPGAPRGQRLLRQLVAGAPKKPLDLEDKNIVIYTNGIIYIYIHLGLKYWFVFWYMW